MPISSKTGFQGVWPILYAFFDETGALDRAAMRMQVDACVRGGAHGIAVMGLATEVGKLDVRERRQIIDWVAEDLNGRLPLAVTVLDIPAGLPPSIRFSPIPSIQAPQAAITRSPSSLVSGRPPPW